MCPTLRYLGDSEKMVREYFAKAEILAKTNQSVIFMANGTYIGIHLRHVKMSIKLPTVKLFGYI